MPTTGAPPDREMGLAEGQALGIRGGGRDRKRGSLEMREGQERGEEHKRLRTVVRDRHAATREEGKWKARAFRRVDERWCEHITSQRRKPKNLATCFVLIHSVP